MDIEEPFFWNLIIVFIQLIIEKQIISDKK